MQAKPEPCDVSGNLFLQAWLSRELQQLRAGSGLDHDPKKRPQRTIPNVGRRCELLGSLPIGGGIRPPIDLVGDAPRQLERVPNILVRQTPVLRNALVYKIRNSIHKHHDIPLQRFGAVREAPDVAKPKDQVHALTRHHGTHLPPIPQVDLDDVAPRLPKRNLQQVAELEEGPPDRPRLLAPVLKGPHRHLCHGILGDGLHRVNHLEHGFDQLLLDHRHEEEVGPEDQEGQEEDRRKASDRVVERLDLHLEHHDVARVSLESAVLVMPRPRPQLKRKCRPYGIRVLQALLPGVTEPVVEGRDETLGWVRA
mmetsp:Transcript_10329/g.25509  ORF Transcript_10329/g.25509 Transcript_10329/m.25509 type:complete len:310 (-) Transcript_10329:450-1379(-)